MEHHHLDYWRERANTYQQEAESLKRENDRLKALIPSPTSNHHSHSLSNSDIQRYSRHLLLPEFGVHGQTSLKNGSVLVVGAGGLGAPVVLYLAGAGVAKIGIIDHDIIEKSNLHRQIIHDESRAGTSKADSAKCAAERLNSTVACIAYNELLDHRNAMRILSDYDVIVDCTDNPATRYLINDACVLLKKPLVSGSALRTEGQLSVLNFCGSPCYRCLFPKPPPPETVIRCGDGGVLGVVPGIIGCLQALETIKVLMHLSSTKTRATFPEQQSPSPPVSLPAVQSGLLLFSGFHQPPFRSVKMRGRNPLCASCGDKPTITELLPDYPLFCGVASPTDAPSNLQLLEPNDRITVSELDSARRSTTQILLLDVRESVQFQLCRLEGSVNVPLKRLEREMKNLRTMAGTVDQVYVLCRLGNDSQTAVRWLKNQGFGNVRDVIGGLNAWARQIDPNFPTY